jgi:hypothetical protein
MNMIDHIAEKITTVTEKDFLKSLRDEKIRAQEARSHLTIQKLTFATALLGLGSIKLDAGVVNTSLLAYLAPWVAIIFDFYIMGEDFSVKRLGAFLQAYSGETLERRWEKWVSEHRDPFSAWAMPILTTLILGAAALILLSTPQVNTPGLLIGWAVASLLATWGIYIGYRRLRKKATDSLPKIEHGKHSRIDEPVNVGQPRN